MDLERAKQFFAKANIDVVETRQTVRHAHWVELTIKAGSSVDDSIGVRVKGRPGDYCTFTFDGGGLLHFIGIGNDG